MINLSTWLDLPVIWGALIGVAVLLYAALDGFDLGCGILFPFAPNDRCRARIMSSIAPFWDGNETWLILGGGGLFVAFPLAYAIILPALYIPIIFMLVGLIFRGVAFEFRYKATSIHGRRFWDSSFHFGAVLATFMQGLILGNFVQGFETQQRNFSGGPLDWFNGYAVCTGLALLFGYGLLASCWLILKTDGELQEWARRMGRYFLVCVALALVFVSVSMVLMDSRTANVWLDYPNFIYLAPLPLLTGLILVWLWRDLVDPFREIRPFFLCQLIFVLTFMGLLISVYPWIIPFEFNIWQAAASDESLSLVLVGTAFLLPIILIYTAYCYYVFRGKVDDEMSY